MSNHPENKVYKHLKELDTFSHKLIQMAKKICDSTRQMTAIEKRPLFFLLQEWQDLI